MSTGTQENSNYITDNILELQMDRFMLEGNKLFVVHQNGIRLFQDRLHKIQRLIPACPTVHFTQFACSFSYDSFWCAPIQLKESMSLNLLTRIWKNWLVGNRVVPKDKGSRSKYE